MQEKPKQRENKQNKIQKTSLAAGAVGGRRCTSRSLTSKWSCRVCTAHDTYTQRKLTLEARRKRSHRLRWAQTFQNECDVLVLQEHPSSSSAEGVKLLLGRNSQGSTIGTGHQRTRRESPSLVEAHHIVWIFLGRRDQMPSPPLPPP